MIDKSKLEALPVEVLFKLKAAVDEVANKKKRALLQTGAIATFTDTRNGEVLRVIVNKFMVKNVNCTELDSSGMPISNKRWRIHANNLLPYFPPAKPKMPAKGVGADKPAQAGAW